MIDELLRKAMKPAAPGSIAETAAFAATVSTDGRASITSESSGAAASELAEKVNRLFIDLSSPSKTRKRSQ